MPGPIFSATLIFIKKLYSIRSLDISWQGKAMNPAHPISLVTITIKLSGKCIREKTINTKHLVYRKLIKLANTRDISIFPARFMLTLSKP